MPEAHWEDVSRGPSEQDAIDQARAPTRGAP